MSAVLANLTTPPPKPSPQELKEGAALRDTARKNLLQKQEVWTKQFQPLNKTLAVPSSVTSPLTSLYESEAKWYLQNIEIAKGAMELHIKEFTEKEETPLKTYNEKVKEILLTEDPLKAKDIVNKWPDQSQKTIFQQAIEKQVKAKETEEKLKKAKENQKDVFEIAMESFQNTLKYVKIIAYICIALFVASFAASESLWQTKPYVMLNYVYALVFAPIFFVYYTYRLIKYQVFNGPPIPMYALIYPNFPYPPKPQEDVTILEFLFGYMNTPELQAWILTKRDQQTTDRQEYLKTDFLDKLRQAKEEERRPIQ